MNYSGQKITLTHHANGTVILQFDALQQAVNKFDAQTLTELAEVVNLLERSDDISGVVITSAKESFIVGADITEFLTWFKLSDEDLSGKLATTHQLFQRLGSLPFPVVAAINGLALGGGFELCLACDYRVMTTTAQVGLPEVKLGIFPGWGGSIRLPRMIGVDNACDWICTGNQKSAQEALAKGAVDAVVEQNRLVDSAMHIIEQVGVGKLSLEEKRAQINKPLRYAPMEKMMIFESVKAMVAAKAGKHYPAPMAAVKSIERSCGESVEKASAIEIKGFITLAKSEEARALIGLFLKDQYVKKIAKYASSGHGEIGKMGVIGAGIMGGGIAYQSASKGMGVVMKDITQSALDIGINEAQSLLDKQIERGKLTPKKAMKTLSAIYPTLVLDDVAQCHVVVEAVVENPQIKQAVLSEVEAQLPDTAILASNTSTIPIGLLAKALKRPDQFCGMHFFNPVHRMPLVEVVRGPETSEATIGKVVALATAMGKTPIVVNDCPGFFVNRVLFPYFSGFTKLVSDGVDFRRIDKVMTGYGWPMGPAQLLDVVGLDTAHHADRTMAVSFPERMGHEGENAIDALYHSKQLGKKSGTGFYHHGVDKRGKPALIPNDDVVARWTKADAEVTDEQIVERMMIPLCLETLRCLEEDIIASPAEGDMALIYGIGFPPFRGGVFHYLDEMGLAAFCALTDQYAELGPLYHPTQTMRDWAASGKVFFEQGTNGGEL